MCYAYHVIHKTESVGQTMTAAEKMYSIQLEENDVPGAKFHCSEVSEHSVCELKRWLECRGLAVSGKKKPELVKMCLECIESNNTDIVIHVDGGKWYEQKVSQVLSSVRTSKSTEAVPFLPTSHWNSFPSVNIPKGFCYGRMYEHIISTAKVYTYNSTSDSENEDSLTDFNTSKPMLKGRQYFTSGHVKNLLDNYKDDHYFLKSSVMASYTQQVVYHVSVTLATLSGKVRDASCDCKASSMGRCSHIASLLFALEDYTLQFGYTPCASTSKLCTWNVGKKSKRQPQPCHSTSYSKKLKADRFRNYDPLCDIEVNETKFVNNFIATLPNSGSDSMFSQILEIDYPDYEVDMEVLKDRTKSALQLMQFEKNTVPFEVPNTQDQTESEMWHSSRFCRITASVAKDVAVVHSKRGKYNLLNRILWGKKLPELKSLKYGRQNEENAFHEYMAENTGKDLTIKRSGFWINPLYPELGCSPDGLVYNQNNKLIGVVEIKCPFMLAGKDPLCVDELNAKKRNNICYNVMNGRPFLKKSHKYYYQVQMQIALCEVDFCDFVIWSSKGMTVERILPDVEFWKDLCSKLINFHHNTLMPEYIEMRIPRRLMPVDIKI